MVAVDNILINKSLNTSTHTADPAACKDVITTHYDTFDEVGHVRFSELEGETNNNNNNNNNNIDESDSEDHILCYPLDDDDVSTISDSELSEDDSEFSEGANEFDWTPRCSGMVIPPNPSQCIAVSETWKHAQDSEGFEDSFGDLVVQRMIHRMQELGDSDMSRGLEETMISSDYSDFCHSIIVVVDMIVYQTQAGNNMFADELAYLGKEFQSHGMVFGLLGASVTDAIQAFVHNCLSVADAEAWRAVMGLGAKKMVSADAALELSDLWSVLSSNSPVPRWSM